LLQPIFKLLIQDDSIHIYSVVTRNSGAPHSVAVFFFCCSFWRTARSCARFLYLCQIFCNRINLLLIPFSFYLILFFVRGLHYKCSEFAHASLIEYYLIESLQRYKTIFSAFFIVPIHFAKKNPIKD